MKPGSKAWKQFMAKLYGNGAAVVIVGAMFKIQHWPFASLLLVVGLTTEAVIFFFSAVFVGFWRGIMQHQIATDNFIQIDKDGFEDGCPRKPSCVLSRRSRQI